jgi:hypothetical protein
MLSTLEERAAMAGGDQITGRCEVRSYRMPRKRRWECHRNLISKIYGCIALLDSLVSGHSGSMRTLDNAQ